MSVLLQASIFLSEFLVKFYSINVNGFHSYCYFVFKFRKKRIFSTTGLQFYNKKHHQVNHTSVIKEAFDLTL